MKDARWSEYWETIFSTRRLLGLCVGRRCHGGARLVRLAAVGRKCLRLVDSSTPRTLSDEDVTTRRDSSDSPSVESAFDSSTLRLLVLWGIFGSPGDRVRAAYPLGKFDEPDAAPFKCVSGRRLSDDPVARSPLTHPERYAPAKCAPDHPTPGSRRYRSVDATRALVGRRSCHRRMMACMVRV